MKPNIIRVLRAFDVNIQALKYLSGENCARKLSQHVSRVAGKLSDKDSACIVYLYMQFQR